MRSQIDTLYGTQETTYRSYFFQCGVTEAFVEKG
jgi:hypothetical protein